MATKTLNARLKIWVDTPTNWNTNNPTLLNGEVGIVKENNNYRMKVGDGNTAWNSLPFYDGNIVVSNMSPTTSDLSYAIGTIWINQNADITQGQFNLYILRSVINTTASWLPIISGTEFSFILNEIQTLSLGNIENDGTIGDAADMVLITKTDGLIDVEAQKTAFNKDFGTNVNDIKENGIAHLGISDKIPRIDHVHPSDSTKVDWSSVGDANGVAPLGEDRKVPAEFLPSYVDDVVDIVDFLEDETDLPSSGMTIGQKWYIESTNKIREAESDTDFLDPYDPESDKIYIKLTDESTWRWSGSTMVSMAQPVAFATTQETIAGTLTTKVVNPKGAYESFVDWIKNKALSVFNWVVGSDTAVTGTDTIPTAIGKLQGQVNNRETKISQAAISTTINLNNDFVVIQIGGATKRIKGSDLLTALGSLGYDDVTIGVNEYNEYYVKDLGISNAKLAGGITKDKIASVRVAALDLDGDILIINGKPS